MAIRFALGNRYNACGEKVMHGASARAGVRCQCKVIDITNDGVVVLRGMTRKITLTRATLSASR